MRLRYGFNEIDGWPAFSMGEDREEIYRRLRLMDTKVVRIFVFDKPVPDPFKEWPWFAALVQGVLDCGAKPMVTFAKFGPPHDDASNIRKFVARSTEIVWSCLEHWGGEEVKDWFWCVWNEPNNPDVGGDLRYKDYLRIYEELAAPVLELLEPHTVGTKVKLGGPSIDGTQRAYWMDWIAQFVSDVEERMLGFVAHVCGLAARCAARHHQSKIGARTRRPQRQNLRSPGDGPDCPVRGARTRGRPAACRTRHSERLWGA
jgi:hypothetical protein